MIRKIKSIKDVVDWGLCTGCGACKYACGRNAVSLENIDSIGIRPRFRDDLCRGCVDCLTSCPGYMLRADSESSEHSEDGQELVGPTLEVWEGYASDKDIRFQGSSGGILSALALYCLEKESMEMVLHTGADSEAPWRNRTVESRDRASLLENAGSRYAPSSPCEALDRIEKSEKPCLFIGKPCDVAAVSMLRKERPALDAKLGLMLSFFCAGPPGTGATLALLEHMGVERDVVKQLRYRGRGWPGLFRVTTDKEEKSLSYEESWGRLAKFPRSLRCQLCPDGLGEFADVAGGDAWHRYPLKENPGLSLVMVRSGIGKDLLHRAVEKGYVELVSSGLLEVIRAQGLVDRRRQLFGRLLALRLCGIPTPEYEGFPLYRLWRQTPLSVQARTVMGTLKRIVRRGLWHRNPVFVS